LVQLYLPGLSAFEAWSAQRQLQDEFPQAGFALNYVYKPYRGATGSEAAPHAAPVPGSKGCSAERCYGPALIKWQPQLAACAAGTTIGVIDTGIDRQHPAFAGRNVTEVVIGTKGGIVGSGPHAHGTGVLSLLAGAPASSTRGLVPDAHFLTVDVFFTNAEGQPETDSVRILQALTELDKRGAQIINMSLVGPRDELVYQKINAMAAHKGVVFVAAAGNGGPDAPAGYPAAYRDEVIAVTAVDHKGASYAHANRGDYIDVAAPGVKIWTALPDRREGAQSGTSFAAPFVTAAIAAAYRDSPLGSPVTEGGRQLDPKGIMLSRLFGDGRKVDVAKRDRIYGLGLLRAPAKCESGGGPWLSAVRPTPAPPTGAAQAPIPVAQPVAAGGWQPSVKRVSLPVDATR
jgi:subtilisin family serine protease